MKKYIGILKFDNGTKIPAKVEAKDKAEALMKIATYMCMESEANRLTDAGYSF